MDDSGVVIRGAKARCPGQAEPVRIGDVVVDLTARRITPRQPEAGEEVRLTPTEWHLLEVLLRSPGRLLSRQQILRPAGARPPVPGCSATSYAPRLSAATVSG